MKYVFYSHIDSGNHGCEAITKSTCDILGCEKEHTYIFSENINLDKKCGLDSKGRLISVPKVVGVKPLFSIFPRLIAKLNIDSNALNKYKYNKVLKNVDSNTIALSTGGDIYCYDNSEWLTFLNENSKKRGAKTVLWGCSIEEERVDNRVLEDLNKYDVITVRESITYNMLLKKGVTSKVYLFPDPAFVLKPTVCDSFPWERMGDIIGINVSKHIIKNESIYKLFKEFINYILNKTNYSIMFIPHVSWTFENDYEILSKLKDEINSDRVYLAEQDLTCNEYKYIVSKCKYYFGARTHSVIAAYSSCVPAIALSYSIKSIGIARDLFGKEDNLVIKIGNDTQLEDLINSLTYLEKNYGELKEKLELSMEKYVDKINEEKEIMKNL